MLAFESGCFHGTVRIQPKYAFSNAEIWSMILGSRFQFLKAPSLNWIARLDSIVHVDRHTSLVCVVL